MGQSHLRTIVETSALVTERPKRGDAGVNALMLGKAINSAYDAGATKVAVEAAFQLGDQIGLSLKGRSLMKFNARPELIVRDVTE